MSNPVLQVVGEEGTSSLSFDLGKEKDFLQQNIRALVEREVPREYARELDEKEEFPHKVWKALAENGYLGIPIEEQYGGVNGDIVDMTIVTEELSRRSGSIGLTFFMSSCFGAKTLQFAGSEMLKRKYLPDLAEGKLMFAFSLTEPDGGTDVLGAMKTNAVEKDDHWVINGQKVWTTWPARTTNYPRKRKVFPYFW